MEDFKINDIVTSRTPRVHQKLGKGIVVEIGKKITVVFPCSYMTYDFREIRPESLEPVEAEPEHYEIIKKVGDTYRRMLRASKKA